MNENWQIALSGLLLTGLGAISVAAVWGFFFLFGKIGRVELKVERLNTKFEDWLDRAGAFMAKALHSPDDHLEVDKYMEKYLEHHHELSLTEWLEFHSICISIMKNGTATKLEKIQAEFLCNLCEHKISSSGIVKTH